MARLAKAAQTALDELDRPCPADQIHGWFMPRARIVLGNLPCPCFDSVERVATELAKKHGDCGIPTGYGSCCVRHFSKRNEQLERISNKTSIEHRFGLLELASLSNIHHGWGNSHKPRIALAFYREYLRQAVKITSASDIERERWRRVIAFVLGNLSSTPVVIRNVAYALVWCGYFSPDQIVTDELLAEQFFDDDREGFNRFRQEGLRLLSMLLEFSIWPSPGDAP